MNICRYSHPLAGTGRKAAPDTVRRGPEDRSFRKPVVSSAVLHPEVAGLGAMDVPVRAHDVY